MKLAVSYDAQGNVTTLFDPAKLAGDKVTLAYVPAKGENHQILDVPKGFESKPFTELPSLLRVNTRGGSAALESKS